MVNDLYKAVIENMSQFVPAFSGFVDLIRNCFYFQCFMAYFVLQFVNP